MNRRDSKMPSSSYRDIAEAIRRDVEAGRWPADKPLPGVDRLREIYDTTRETAHRAVRHLVAAGLLYTKPRRGTFIRPRVEKRAIVRDRIVYRDEIGYFFDRNAQGWRALDTPTQKVEFPPRDVADALGISREDRAMLRDRRIGPPGAEYATQLTTSYLPMPLVGEIPVLAASDTGPGGIYDRIEEHFGAPIEWTETVSARPATDEEQEALNLGAGLPVLVVSRSSVLRDRVVEVNQTRMSADSFAVSYAVVRDTSAQWPRGGSD